MKFETTSNEKFTFIRVKQLLEENNLNVKNIWEYSVINISNDGIKFEFNLKPDIDYNEDIQRIETKIHIIFDIVVNQIKVIAAPVKLAEGSHHQSRHPSRQANNVRVLRRFSTSPNELITGYPPTHKLLHRKKSTASQQSRSR